MNTQANGFDIQAFLSADLSPREEEVSVEGLQQFFPEGEAPLWKIRGLTASEIAKATDAGMRNKNFDSILTAISATSKNEKVKEFRKAFGVSDDVPAEIVKRIEHLVFGSVSPEVDQQIAVKLANAFPIEFYDLTNRITRLSGMGMEIAKEKQKPSGEKEE